MALSNKAVALEQPILTRSFSPAGSNERVVRFGKWRMLCDRFEVLDPNGNQVPLTTGEFLLLRSFLMSPGRVLSREHLLNVTRGMAYEGFDHAIDIQVGRIRKKLRDDLAHPSFIKTVRDVGYIFLPTVNYENF